MVWRFRVSLPRETAVPKCPAVSDDAHTTTGPRRESASLRDRPLLLLSAGAIWVTCQNRLQSGKPLWPPSPLRR